LEDFGHNNDDGKFFAQLDYLIPELYRVLKPGRVAAIHVKDRILYGHQTPHGFMEVEEFSDDTVKAFKRHGFINCGRRTIVTDVVRENNSTYRLGWSEMAKDATKMGCGLPEYLLLFRKPPSANAQQYADEPVTKSKDEYTRGRWQVDAHSLWRSSGNRLLAPDEMARMDPGQVSRLFGVEQLNTVYDHERHIAICETRDQRGHLPSSYMLLPPKVTRNEADSVWDDVVTMRTLNTDQSRARERNHICPLPLDIVERTIRLYSNPGDVVLDPFAGLFSVPYVAVKMGRFGLGIELSAEYYAAGVGYCQDIERQVLTPTLFDYLEMNEPELLHRNGTNLEVRQDT
ncbi:MAG: DNA methyltransferase, partial [Gammaproteobacteria bacterium]